MTRALYSSGREAEPNIITTTTTTPPDTGGGANDNNSIYYTGGQRPGHHPLLSQHSQSLASLPILEDTNGEVSNNNNNNNNNSNNNNNNNTTTTPRGLIQSSQSVSDLSHYQKRNQSLERSLTENHHYHHRQHWYNNHSNHHRSANNSSSSNNNNNSLLVSQPHHQHHVTSPRLGQSLSSSHLMSIRDSPGRGPMPVSRSHSFGGVSVGSNSSTGGGSMSGSFHSMSPTAIPPVLGGTLRGVAGARQGRSQLVSQYGGIGRSFHRKSPKVPKVPRPARALMVFDSVKRGIGWVICGSLSPSVAFANTH